MNIIFLLMVIPLIKSIMFFMEKIVAKIKEVLEKRSGIEIKTLGMLLKQLGKAGKTSYPDFNIKIPIEEDEYPYGYGEIEWDYLYKKIQKVTANKKDSGVDLTLDLSRGRILEIRLSYNPKTPQKEKDKIDSLMENLEENGWLRQVNSSQQNV